MNTNVHPLRNKVYPAAEIIERLQELDRITPTEIQRDFLLVHWLLIDVELNGFRAFVENPRGGPFLDRLANALEQLGAPALAAAAQRVVNILPVECRAEKSDDRRRAYEQLDEKALALISQFESHACNGDEDLLRLQCDFLQQHESDFPACDAAALKRVRDRVLGKKRECEDRIKELATIWSGKHRACPRCGTRFKSVQNRGACPKCSLVFYASHPTNQNDWPMGEARMPDTE